MLFDGLVFGIVLICCYYSILGSKNCKLINLTQLIIDVRYFTRGRFKMKFSAPCIRFEEFHSKMYKYLHTKLVDVMWKNQSKTELLESQSWRYLESIEIKLVPIIRLLYFWFDDEISKIVILYHVLWHQWNMRIF